MIRDLTELAPSVRSEFQISSSNLAHHMLKTSVQDLDHPSEWCEAEGLSECLPAAEYGEFPHSRNVVPKPRRVRTVSSVWLRKALSTE